MAYHYQESGLEDVFLEDGYAIHQTPYGQGVSIRDTEGLHKAIGRWLVWHPKPLDGADVRFLRLELEFTQRALASLLGTTEQTVRLWEKHRHKAVPGSADRLLRALYLDCIGEDGSVRRVADRLAGADDAERREVHLRQTDQGWEPTELVCAG